MKRIYVASSDIASIGYDVDARTLEIEFRRGGRVYRYEDVPPDVAAKLIESPSVGAHFAAKIKGKYGYTQVKEQ